MRNGCVCAMVRPLCSVMLFISLINLSQICTTFRGCQYRRHYVLSAGMDHGSIVGLFDSTASCTTVVVVPTTIAAVHQRRRSDHCRAGGVVTSHANDTVGCHEPADGGRCPRYPGASKATYPREICETARRCAATTRAGDAAVAGGLCPRESVDLANGSP